MTEIQIKNLIKEYEKEYIADGFVSRSGCFLHEGTAAL